MIFELDEESLLPEDYSPPTRRTSRHRHRHRHTNQVAFVEETNGTSGTTIQSHATLKTIIDSIAQILKDILLVLVGIALVIALVALLQYYLMISHIISDPRMFL